MDKYCNYIQLLALISLITRLFSWILIVQFNFDHFDVCNCCWGCFKVALLQFLSTRRPLVILKKRLIKRLLHDRPTEVDQSVDVEVAKSDEEQLNTAVSEVPRVKASNQRCNQQKVDDLR